MKAGFYTFASDECADFLDKLNSPVIPGTSGFRGNWVRLLAIIIIISSSSSSSSSRLVVVVVLKRCKTKDNYWGYNVCTKFLKSKTVKRR